MGCCLSLLLGESIPESREHEHQNSRDCNDGPFHSAKVHKWHEHLKVHDHLLTGRFQSYLSANHGGHITPTTPDRTILPSRNGQHPPMVRFLVLLWSPDCTMAALRVSAGHTLSGQDETHQACFG